MIFGFGVDVTQLESELKLSLMYERFEETEEISVPHFVKIINVGNPVGALTGQSKQGLC